MQGARMQGAMGELWGGWEHVNARLSRKQGALVSRSHHHRQQSMNEYEATFMNILLGVIFLFQLSFSPSLFPPFFQALSDPLSAALIFRLLLLVLSPPVSVFFVSLAAVCLRTWRPFFPPQGVTSRLPDHI